MHRAHTKGKHSPRVRATKTPRRLLLTSNAKPPHYLSSTIRPKLPAETDRRPSDLNRNQLFGSNASPHSPLAPAPAPAPFRLARSTSPSHPSPTATTGEQPPALCVLHQYCSITRTRGLYHSSSPSQPTRLTFLSLPQSLPQVSLALIRGQVTSSTEV